MSDPKDVIWKWAAGLLVLCNVALIATLWLKKQPAPLNMGRETPRDFVIRNLKLNDSQVKSYDTLINAHQADMHRLRKNAMEERQLLFTGLSNDGKGPASTDSLASDIAGTQKEIELVTYRHFARVRALCSPAQKATFDEIIGEVIKKMNSGGPPPHGPGPGQPNDRPGGEGPPPDGPPEGR